METASAHTHTKKKACGWSSAARCTRAEAKTALVCSEYLQQILYIFLIYMNRSFGEHPLIASLIGYLNIDILGSLDYA
jgi:hypothetical protein